VAERNAVTVGGMQVQLKRSASTGDAC